MSDEPRGKHNLERCPCCGSKDVHMESHIHERHNFVECHACGLATAAWGSEELAAWRWNDRYGI